MDKIQTATLLMLTLMASVVSNVTHATIYDVSSVLSGSNTPGFNASAFHDSSGSNVMAGATLAGINSVISGSYNDSNGFLSVNLGMSNGGSFTLDGFLVFGANDTLTAHSTVNINFDAIAEADGFSDTSIGFMGINRVCCSGAYAPNSLVAGIDSQIMTLWGANFAGNDFNGGYEGSTLGMDLVLDLTRPGLTIIPVPAAVWLFGSGLLGLVGVARRRTV